jgi:hypothetical protein
VVIATTKSGAVQVCEGREGLDHWQQGTKLVDKDGRVGVDVKLRREGNNCDISSSMAEV